MHRMTRRALRVAALLLAGVLGLGATHAGADSPLIERIPLPAGASLNLIGHDLVQNGRRMSLATFAAERGVEETLAWYRERWPDTDDGPGHVEAESDGWKIVSRLQEDSNIALQVKTGTDGGAYGFLSVMPLVGDTVAASSPALPPGVELLSDTRADDAYGQSRTVLMRSPGRPGEVAAFYRDRLERDGWTLQNGDIAASPAVLLFSSGQGRIELVATAQSGEGTFIVLNSVTGAR